ncbi:MAG: hypothetical protein EOM23_04045 [Candidatus Moranbacteria bacterium]|nr:hypothetical protein [Candidatus Moranbacteria bacterium]
MKTKCYSVRLESLISISDKAFKAVAFDGSEAIIPKSQVFGQDFEVIKCDAYWISSWILKQKDIQYSDKKVAFFDEQGNVVPTYTIEKHVPARVEPVKTNIHADLIK